jgi:hypothetical protein
MGDCLRTLRQVCLKQSRLAGGAYELSGRWPASRSDARARGETEGSQAWLPGSYSFPNGLSPLGQPGHGTDLARPKNGPAR